MRISAGPIEGESISAFCWFKVYRDLGPFRSYAQVAHQVGKNIRTIERVGARNHWVERAVAYEVQLEEVEVKARILERRRLGRLQSKRALSYRTEILDEIRSRNLSQLSMEELWLMLQSLEGMWPVLRRTFPVNMLPN